MNNMDIKNSLLQNMKIIRWNEIVTNYNNNEIFIFKETADTYRLFCPSN